MTRRGGPIRRPERRRLYRRIGIRGAVRDPYAYHIPLRMDMPWIWRYEIGIVVAGLLMAGLAIVLEQAVPGSHTGTVMRMLTGTNFAAILTVIPFLVYEVYHNAIAIVTAEGVPSYGNPHNGLVTVAGAPGEEVLFRLGLLNLVLVGVSALAASRGWNYGEPGPVLTAIEPLTRLLGLSTVFSSWEMAVAGVSTALVFGLSHIFQDSYVLEKPSLFTLQVVLSMSATGIYYTEVALAGGLLPVILLHVASNGVVFVSHYIALKRARDWK